MTSISQVRLPQLYSHPSSSALISINPPSRHYHPVPLIPCIFYFYFPQLPPSSVYFRVFFVVITNMHCSAFLPASPLAAHPFRRRRSALCRSPLPSSSTAPRRRLVATTSVPSVVASVPTSSVPISSGGPSRAKSTLRSLSAAAIAVLAAFLSPSSASAIQRSSFSSSSVTISSTSTSSSALSLSQSRTPFIRNPSSAIAVIAPPATVSSTSVPTFHARVASARQRVSSLSEQLRDALQSSENGHSHDDSHDSHGAAVSDALVLLLTTVIIIPIAQRLGISPILGFLAAGIALGPNGLALIRDVRTSKALAELGVVFFLFEMGLELSTSKLKSLGADVFGLGTSQFLGTGAVLTAVASMCGIATQPAIVLGAGLALSSSAFVLQLLGERGEVGTRFGRAAFGILLFQDLAVVPVLVLTPLLAGSGGAAAVFQAISIASAKAAVALAFIFFMGKNFLQPVFRFVARARSSEAFIAVILFTVLATSSLTQMLGLSDTLGAFLAGVMLAETKFRHQVEADIKPFRGLLLGLFFITVGFSIDLNLAWANLGAVASMVGGLLLAKTAIIALAGVTFGLSLGSALRTGLLLSQGGEFAFVIFGLATSVGVLPADVAQLMLLVVAVSMALTPLLADIGRRISVALERKRGLIGVRMEDADSADARDFVMVAGWGRVGQSVCEMLDAKLVRYMAFDMSPTRVIDARNKGLPVFFGDARRPEVLRSAGVERARAVVVTLDDPDQALLTVQNIRREFEDVQVFCRARDVLHQKLLQAAGATAIVPELLEASLLLGGAVLLDYGTPVEEVNALIEEGRHAHLVELGITDSITSKLGSSFREHVELKEANEERIGSDGTEVESATVCIDDVVGYDGPGDSVEVAANAVDIGDVGLKSGADGTGDDSVR